MATVSDIKPGEECRSALFQRSRYLLLLKISAVTTIVGILFGRVLADMARDWWNDPALSQGMLLPPLALYVTWINRRQTLHAAAAPDRRGLLLTGIACVMFLLGSLASEFFLMRFSFVVLLTALVWTFWGLPPVRTLALPLLLLATMVPLPVLVYNSVAAPLQLLASDVATRLSQIAGTSVYREGNIIHLANVSLGVAEACSGLASLSALIVASVLLGFLVLSRPLARVILLLAALPLAIVVNIVRVTGTAIMADYKEDLALGFYHAFSGWLVFLVGFGLLYASAAVLHRLLDRAETCS